MPQINCKELHPCNLVPWGTETPGLGESQPAFSKALGRLVPRVGSWGPPSLWATHRSCNGSRSSSTRGPSSRSGCRCCPRKGCTLYRR